MNQNYIIYKVKNIWTGEVYIGATTNSIHQRRLDHLERSKRGESGKFHIALASWTNAFVWTQIDTANTVNELAQKEKDYIFHYNSKENGYNSSGGGEFKKKVFQYDPETLFLVAEYNSLEEAGESVEAHKNSIAKACCGENRTCKGFYWSYTLTEPFVVQGDLRKKKVVQYDLEGNLIAQFESVSEASKITGVSKTCISRCCRGERKQTRGFIWKYS